MPIFPPQGEHYIIIIWMYRVSYPLTYNKTAMIISLFQSVCVCEGGGLSANPLANKTDMHCYIIMALAESMFHYQYVAC